MVTFTSDYWAPALDVHVRRRMSTDKSLLHTAPSSAPINIASAGSTRSSSSSSSGSSWEYAPHVPSNPTSKKLRKFAKFFHHDSHSPSTSPPESPISYDGDLDQPTASPDSRKNLKGLLAPKLGARTSLRKGETPSSSFKEETSFLKKYGVCEKGCIGKGATAVVRLAHKMDAKSAEEKLYAVKEFRKRRKNESEKEYVKKLTSEFCISSTLHHPNVVETVDLIQDDHQNYCTVMEYCPGGDLYNIIKNGNMTSVEIDCCFKQLIQGVAYLHSMGVAHRDIKPENLLLDNAGKLKITDFGVSDVFRMCWESMSHMSKGLCGSEPYIAPEEFEEKEYSAPSVDIWSCGIVYYCMSFQGIPFRVARSDDHNYQHYLEARKSKSYEPFEKLSAGCRDLMYRILDPDVRKRATIQDIMANEWFKNINVCSDSRGYSDHRHVVNKSKH